MIERKKSRKRKPSRFGPKKHSGLKNNNFHNKSVPRSRNDISRALEKYNSLAQDAQSNGDRIVAENFFQYAEHYQRLLNDHPKPELNNGINKNNSIGENKEIEDVKLSRTERAINAKNARLNKIEPKVNDESEDNKKKKDDFTSDGLEALKPFEASLTEKKSHST